MDAFINLRKQLISEPVMAFPRVDRQYALITDATTGTAEMPGGLGAILTQVDKDGKFYAISFPSQQLKDHENKYSPFLLEAVAPVWGMDHFNEYLKGKKFILYTDHKPLEKLGHFHSKMMNRFQTASLGHNFIIQYKKGSDMPADYLPRLPATTTEPVIAAFDTFEPGRATKGKTICSKHSLLQKTQPVAESSLQIGSQLSCRPPQKDFPWQRRHFVGTLDDLPAEEKSHDKANTTSAIASTRKTELEDPCWFIRADVDSWQ